MSVQSEINRINTAVTGQADLIAQIQTALEGKAGGGGGSVETCTVTITSDSGSVGGFLFTTYSNGEFNSSINYSMGNPVSTPIVIENVVCNSAFMIDGTYSPPGWAITNGSFEDRAASAGSLMARLVALGGSNVTIKQYNND